MCFYMHGLVLKLLMLRQQLSPVDPDTIVGEEPLGPATYEVLVNVVIRRDTMVPYEYEGLQSIADADTGPLHDHLAR